MFPLSRYPESGSNILPFGAIRGNAASWGGGVAALGSTFNMYGGVISDNMVSASAGGVLLSEIRPSHAVSDNSTCNGDAVLRIFLARHPSSEQTFLERGALSEWSQHCGKRGFCCH